jgi:hypothetical protein
MEETRFFRRSFSVACVGAASRRISTRTHIKSSHGSRCISWKRLARREEGAYPKVCDRRATQPGAFRETTRRAGVLLPSGFVARSSRSYGYAPHSTPRQKAKALPARPVSTFDMSSRRPHPAPGDRGLDAHRLVGRPAIARGIIPRLPANAPGRGLPGNPASPKWNAPTLRSPPVPRTS